MNVARMVELVRHRRWFLRAVVAGCSGISTTAAPAGAQTPTDSALIAQAIVSRALRDAQRQGREIQALVFARSSEQTITSTQATVEVVLGCSAGITGRMPFAWWLAYGLKRTGRSWIVSSVHEIAIT
jgi:ABC-type Co2+ transport system permease subunit